MPSPATSRHPRPATLSSWPSLAGSALRVLERHRGTALTAADLEARIPLEGGLAPDKPQAFLDAVRARDDLFRVLSPRPRPRRWAGAVQGPWVLARRPPAEGAGHPILDRVRESLRRLAAEVDPGSLRETARWERYLLEESQLQRGMERRLRREARRAGRRPLPSV